MQGESCLHQGLQTGVGGDVVGGVGGGGGGASRAGRFCWQSRPLQAVPLGVLGQLVTGGQGEEGLGDQGAGRRQLEAGLAVHPGLGKEQLVG